MARVHRVARIGAGLSLLMAGVAMLVLPGPGMVTIVGALSVLSRDWRPARRALDAARARLPGLRPALPVG